MPNLAYSTGSFNNQPVISPQTVALVLYKQPTKDRGDNDGSETGDYSSAIVPVPVAPIPMMSRNPIYGNEPNIIPMDLLLIMLPFKGIR